jgi:hypothetical protein
MYRGHTTYTGRAAGSSSPAPLLRAPCPKPGTARWDRARKGSPQRFLYPAPSQANHPAWKDFSPTMHQPEHQYRSHQDEVPQKECTANPGPMLLTEPETFLRHPERKSQRPGVTGEGIEKGHHQRQIHGGPAPACGLIRARPGGRSTRRRPRSGGHSRPSLPTREIRQACTAIDQLSPTASRHPGSPGSAQQ